MFKRHPKGLPVLFLTEIWERVGFYILSAILVLYMESEFKWDDARKGDVYGLYLFLAYFFPMVGGWLGDKVLGPQKTIRLGAITMVIGYVLLAASHAHRVSFFLLGLLFVAMGTGVFKVNMSVSVGNLYARNDPLKDAGFNLYYMGVNIGAMIAPLIATAVSIWFHSYNISFGVAAAGMVTSLVIFETGKKRIVNFGMAPSSSVRQPAAGQESDPLEDRQRVATLFTLFAIVVFFWVAFYQNGFALTLFASRSTVRYEYLRPETYQFFNPFFILLLTPAVISIFSRLRAKAKEPANPTKILLGMFFSGFSMVIMTFAGLAGGDLDVPLMSPWWLITSYFAITVSEILVSPMGQSFVTKVAPRRWQGLMMGFWFLATSLGSYGSGALGRFYSSFTHHEYYAILAVMLFFAAGLVLTFMKRLNRFAS